DPSGRVEHPRTPGAIADPLAEVETGAQRRERAPVVAETARGLGMEPLRPDDEMGQAQPTASRRDGFADGDRLAIAALPLERLVEIGPRDGERFLAARLGRGAHGVLEQRGEAGDVAGGDDPFERLLRERESLDAAEAMSSRELHRLLERARAV